MRLHLFPLLKSTVAIPTMPLALLLATTPSVLAQSVPTVNTSTTLSATPVTATSTAIAAPAPVLYQPVPVNYPIAYPGIPVQSVYPGGTVYPVPNPGQVNPNGMSVQVNIGVPGQATYPGNTAQPVYPGVFPVQGTYPNQAIYPATIPAQGGYPVIPGQYPYPTVPVQGIYPPGIYNAQPTPPQTPWNSAAIASVLGNSQWLQKLVEADRLYQSGQTTQAEQIYQDAMSLINNQYPTQYLNQASALKAQIDALSKANRWAEAAILARQFALNNANSTIATDFEKLAQDNLKRAQADARRKATGNLLGTVLKGGLGYLLTGKTPDPASTLQSIFTSLSELRQSRNITFP